MWISVTDVDGKKVYINTNTITNFRNLTDKTVINFVNGNSLYLDGEVAKELARHISRVTEETIWQIGENK